MFLDGGVVVSAWSVLGLRRQVARVKRQRVAHHLITRKACRRAETKLASNKGVLREAYEGEVGIHTY
jgi:hypothetical protein